LPKKKAKRLNIKAKELMVSPPLTIPLDATVDEAAGLMWEKNVGSLIVVDKAGKLAGIITEKDIVFSVTKSLIGRGVPVSSVMSRTAVLAGPNEALVAGIEKMRKAGVRHLPVVDREGNPLGVLSMRDALDVSGPLLKFIFRTSATKKKKKKRVRR
jgi:CBS domain-containing protein